MGDDSLQYRWPADFPEGIPEKVGVVPAEGKVYRLVRTIPPTKVDFQRHRDEKPKYPYQSHQIPLSYGMSVWSKLERIRKAEKNYPCPEQLGSWITVCGSLFPELGVIPAEIEKSGHITLWIQDGAEPHKHIKDEVTE